MDGDCLPKDKPCQWREGGTYPFSDKGITCPYLRKAVLPVSPELERLYYAHLEAADGNTGQEAMKDNCHRCAQPMVKASNRQKYCAGCRGFMYQRKNTQYIRNQRQR